LNFYLPPAFYWPPKSSFVFFSLSTAFTWFCFTPPNHFRFPYFPSPPFTVVVVRCDLLIDMSSPFCFPEEPDLDSVTPIFIPSVSSVDIHCERSGCIFGALPNDLLPFYPLQDDMKPIFTALPGPIRVLKIIHQPLPLGPFGVTLRRSHLEFCCFDPRFLSVLCFPSSFVPSPPLIRPLTSNLGLSFFSDPPVFFALFFFDGLTPDAMPF